ncbi:MAG: M50 family metallopeptidase [Candidatus Tectomicrobia bacterium]|nr:M50 family metallopeptidase [Candidatus Tectomicrobia bacterium]
MSSEMRLRRINYRQLTLFMGIGLAGLLLWFTPVILPFKIFVVFLHETFHALAAVATGGRVLEMQVSIWQSGYVKSSGGVSVIVASAGYVGSAVFGGLLLILAARDDLAQALFGVLAALFAIVTLLFVRNAFGLFFGLGATALFALLAWKNPPYSAYFVDVLAVLSSLYAIYDLADFLLYGGPTDATILAAVTHVPATIWAILWTVISFVVVFASFRVAVRAKPPAAGAPS